MEQARKIYIVVFAMVLINSVIVAEAALSLGSVQVTKSASLSAGESVRFKILLFNAHDTNDLFITASYESPAGWDVSVSPSAFMIPYREVGDVSKEDGFEFLGTGAGDVKAKPVWINVRVPEDEFSGTYEVRLVIRAKKGSSGVSMSQSRTYKYSIEVLGAEQEQTQEEEEEQQSEEKEQQKSSQQTRPEQESPATLPQENIPGITYNQSDEFREQAEDRINGLTGMIISNPMVAPVALSLAVIVFLVLRYLKRI